SWGRPRWRSLRPGGVERRTRGGCIVSFFFFKQKTAYEIGLGIPAEPLFRSLLVVEQHRTQIVIHALLKCQQENLYHEQNVTHIKTSLEQRAKENKPILLHQRLRFLKER